MGSPILKLMENHILTISVSNEKNPASTNNFILVDAIEVTVLDK
ncbi:MAG: hypothetical protein Q8M95_04855 [Candidatus Methanoperedens sp.]|nr:hypothetical protein [Candidatus Methanoperedens sp.]